MTSAKRIEELEAALAALLWPIVPSADEYRLLVRCLGGTSKAADAAVEFADRLHVAQERARELLSKPKRRPTRKGRK